MRCEGLVVPALALAAGCLSAGQEEVSFPLRVAGTAVDGPVPGRDGALVQLTRAELAFGPLVLCSGAQAGELCDTARAQWLGSVAFDVLSPTTNTAGDVDGFTGPVLSWMFDLGITSLLTQPDPLVLPAADALGGHSVRVEGVATVDGVAIPFSAELRVQQDEQTELGVPVIRKSTSDAFDHEITVDEPGLVVRFDATPWIADIDFAALLREDPCAPGGPLRACSGTLEQTCADDGTVAAQRDCGEAGLVCLRDLGCTDAIEFEQDSQGARAIRNQLVAGQRPAFDWTEP